MRLVQNKTELFCYLSQFLFTNHRQTTFQLICVFETVSITSDPDVDLSFVLPCNNEKEDTRAADTDVLVLSRLAFTHLTDKVHQLWIDFGTGNKRKFFAIDKIYENIGADKAQVITFFLAITGFDQVSFLSHVTKKSAWKVWDLFKEITPVFCRLNNQPSLNKVKESLPTVERLTVLSYHCISNCITMN